MPQQIVDKVLCDGTNESDSVIKICVEFSKNKPIAEKAAFLKKLYGVDGKGFVLNGSKVAAWWNEQGISISYGTTAQGLGAEVTSWENAAKRIDELLDLGRFAPQDVLLQMRSFELMKTAEEFWELHRDLDTENYPVLAELFPDEWFKGGYPDSTARIAELLKSTDGYEKILNITGLIKNSYANNDEIMRFQLYNPVRVYNTLSELQLERKAYTSETLTAGFREKYISDDEINNLFVRQGSGIQNGKYRIYLYFKANTDTKDRIAFLKNEYGTGGSYNGRSNNTHDSKGIKFSHGSLMNPFAKADISWNDAVKRIDRLIKQNKYLSEKEIANIPQYEKEELAGSINEEYIEWMSADYKNTARGELLDSPRSLNEYDINTPTRLLTGISYTLPGVGLITADYERVWYNRMKLRNMGTENWEFQQTINNEVSSFYQPANNFRVGIEATPTQNFYIRAGYANYGECIATRDAFNNMSSINSYENYSAGLGFRFQNMYVDLAYIYTEYKYAPYTMFYYGDPNYVINPGNVETKQSRNTITMSVGVRF